MRIGIVAEYVRPWPGGISEHVHHEALELTRLGHEVTVCSGPLPSGHRDPELPYHVERLPWALTFTGNGARSRLSLGLSLARLATSLARFEVLHVHAPLDPVLCLAATLAAPCPVVGTFHASFERSLAWDALYRGLGVLMEPAHRKLAARISVSAEAQRSIAQYFSGESTIVPNGVDLSRFTPVRTQAEPPRNLRILFVGRADRRKGLPFLLRAFARVLDSLPDLTLQLAGVTALEAGASGAPLRRVHALGYVEPEVLPTHYAEADLVCAPSLAGESQGIVLLEAMASGKPLVCFDIPGYRDVVCHGRTAWIAKEASEGALAHALLAALHDADFRARAQSEGPRVAASYAWPDVARRLEAILLSARQA